MVSIDKKWYENYAWGLALFFSIILALFIVRKALLAPGLIEQGDLVFHYDINLWRGLVQGIPAWDDIHSMPIVNILTPITLWLSWLVDSVESLERAIYVLCFTLMAFTMFMVTFSMLKDRCKKTASCYIASTTASIIYVLNPLTLGFVGWWPALLGYSLLPSFFLLIPKAFNESSWKKTAKYGLISALIVTLNFVSHFSFMVTVLSVLFIILVLFLLHVRRGFKRSFLRSLALLGMVIILPILLGAYITFPTIFYYMGVGIGWRPYTWLPLQHFQLYQVGFAAIRIFDAFRLWKWSLESPFSFDLVSISTLTVPFLSLLAVILLIIKIKTYKIGKNLYILSIGKNGVIDNKSIVLLSFYALVCLFLAKGVNEPFGNFYIWLCFKVSEFFKNSERWIQGLSLSYALLSSFLVAETVERVHVPKKGLKYSRKCLSYLWNAKVVVILIAIILVSASISSQPLLTGDAGGLLSPAPLPTSYYSVNKWLSSQSDEYRTVWLPTFGGLTWYPQNTGAQHIGFWASSRPVASDWNPSQNSFMGYALTYLGESDGPDLLGLYSIKYVIFHNDTFDIEDNKRLYETLERQYSFREVYNEGFLHVFLNEKFEPYIRPLDLTVLSFGNLKTLSLSKSIDKFDPSGLAIIFGEQKPMLGMRTLKHLTSDDVILFYNKEFTDLLFNSINPNYIYPLSDYLRDNLYEDWRAETRKQIFNYELDYGKGVIYSLVDDLPFSFNFKVESSTRYEVWARVITSIPERKVHITIDGSPVGVAVAPSLPIPNAVWVKAGDLWLEKGEHRLTMTNKITQGLGPFINLISVVPSEELEKNRELITDYMSSSNAKIVYILDKESFQESKRLYSLLYDDFSQYPEGYDFNDSLTFVPVKGTWVVNNGILVGSASANNFTTITAGELPWSDYIVEVKIRDEDASATTGKIENYWRSGIIFRYTDEDNYMVYHVSNVGHYLVRVVNGTNSVVAYEREDIAPKTWHTLRVEARGSSIKCYFDNRTIFSIEDSSLKTGKVDLRNWADNYPSQTSYDDFNITGISPVLTKMVYAPIASNYVLAVRRAVGPEYGNLTLKIGSQESTISCKNDSEGFDWGYSSPVFLSQGLHEISIILQGEFNVDKIFLYTTPNEKPSMTLDEIFKAKEALPTVSYKKVSPERWLVEVNATKPFILAFSETYHDLWNAYTEDLTYEKVPLYYQINGFLINKTGHFTIKLEFTAVKSLELGILVSGVTLVSTIICYIFIEDRLRKNLIRIVKMAMRRRETTRQQSS